MDRETANSIFNEIKSFKYTSLEYSEPDDILNSEVLCFNSDAIILYTPEEKYIKIHWASNDAESILNIVGNLKNEIYIEFIPEEFLDQFSNYGLSMHSEFLDFFNMDLQNNVPTSICVNDILFLTLNECCNASELTKECESDSRGFKGDTEEWFKEWINSEYGKVIIIKEQELIAGLCCVNLYDIENKAGPTAWFREIVVKPCYRGRGFGKKLFEQAICYAVAIGAKRGFLHCDVENKNAISLYNKYGFYSKQERGQINMKRSAQGGEFEL